MTAETPLRFEDVAQDGRVVLSALQHLLGATTWPAVFSNAWAHELRHAGVVPILTYLELEGGDGPFSNVGCLVQADGRWEIGHAKNARGEVERLLVSMWVEARAPIGSTYGPPPPRAGELAFAGRVYAEHVVTRLFAPPGERKVLRLDVSGLAPVPPAVLRSTPPDDASALPPGAEILGEREAEVTFGVLHTDGNQHVNSLVYARLFEEAALPLLAERSALSRKARLGYRKPLFAGDRARVVVRAYRSEGRLGACGRFEAEGKPHVHVGMTF